MTGTLVVRPALCIGCLTCVIACKQENRTGPGVSWIRVEEHQARAPDRIAWTLHTCLQCDPAPCLDVCRSGALERATSGVIGVDAAICIFGCDRCAVACPHGALHPATEGGYFEAGQEPQSSVLPHQQHMPGTMSLCTLCAHRTGPQRQTACTEACPTVALVLEHGAPGPLVRIANDLPSLPRPRTP